MSFFSDLFEGKFNNLTTDITHAPSSLIHHPTELLETAGGAAALAGGLFFAPEIAGLFSGGAGADAAAAAAGAGGLSADAGLLDISGAAAADSAFGAGVAGADAGADALAFAPVSVDALSLGPGAGGDILPEAATLDSGALDLTGDAGASATPSGYAPTDAELSGGVTGTAPASGSTSAGGGFTDTLKSILHSPYTQIAAGATPLALALSRGEPSIPSQANPAIANATALANQGSNLNPSQNASLQQMRQNAINAARQALFNQGVQNPESDTRYSQMVLNIDSQVTAAAQTMIQQNIQNSLQGDAVLMSVAQMQMQADQNFTNTLVNATKAFGTVAGLSSGINLKLAA